MFSKQTLSLFTCHEAYTLPCIKRLPLLKVFAVMMSIVYASLMSRDLKGCVCQQVMLLSLLLVKALKQQAL